MYTVLVIDPTLLALSAGTASERPGPLEFVAADGPSFAVSVGVDPGPTGADGVGDGRGSMIDGCCDLFHDKDF